jgi:hypothetical protein
MKPNTIGYEQQTHKNSTVKDAAAFNVHIGAATSTTNDDNRDNFSSLNVTATAATNDNGVTVQAKAVASASSFFASLHDPDVIERVRTSIKHSHVFKLPTRQTGSIGWRGADWKEKVWHGTVKVVDRNDMTAVMLVDSVKGTIYAVCPIRDGVNAVERCVDSSRYFVLRIENQAGRHMFIGLAFNERNDAFDFNTALQDAQKEREFEKRGGLLTATNESASFSLMGNHHGSQQKKDYSLREGQKIKVNIPKKQSALNEMDSDDVGGAGGTKAFANFQATGLDEDDFQNSNVSNHDKMNSSTVDVGSFTTRTWDKKNNLIKKGGYGRRGNASSGVFLLKPSAKDTPARKQL